jgi:EAL domain-containing protein (putative c-di-GMP-specific phosphodiesterase class I)
MQRKRINWTLSTEEGGESAPARGVRALTVADIGVVFQPIVEIATGSTFAYEALVRCRVPEYAAPPVLLEHAVAEGACGKLGRMIRDVAFGTCGDVALFVNLHPDELTARWLVRPDDPIGFHSRAVYLEITESAMLSHFELCRDVVAELSQRTGARLVVDDFGAGYSNLERIVELEPSVVKLDLALTRDIHFKSRKQVVVRHLVNLCTELRASVVAEGVETLDELKCVRDLGVTYAQGYLLAHPASPPPVASWPLDSKRLVATEDARPRRPGPPPLPKRKEVAQDEPPSTDLPALSQSARPTKPAPAKQSKPTSSRPGKPASSRPGKVASTRPRSPSSGSSKGSAR